MSENFTPVKTEVAQSGEATENSKLKKKKKAIGAFVVEADPADTSKSFWRRPKVTDKESRPSILNPEINTDSETLSEAEKTEAVKRLAAARQQELTNPELESTASPEETEAALAYLAAVEAAGKIENTEVTPPHTDETVIESIAPTENVIETDQPSEGEILLDNEPSDPSPPSEPASGNGRGNVPPRTPNYSQEEYDQPEDPIRPAGSFIRPAAIVTTLAAGNVVPMNVALQNERRAQTDGLIVGVLVGYFVGRRRGRIKTEKKLLPVQKKLEKQVEALRSELITQEYQVRQKVREQLTINSAEKTAVGTLNMKQEKQPKTKLAPSSTERIGHVLVAASSSTEKAPTVKGNQPQKQEVMAVKKRVETMDRTELLAISQTIIVEGASLRQIYETQLISEKGLRRLITEHLRGGNISRALKRELIERQIDFERDPLLRDKSYKNSADNAGKAALAGMLSKAGLAEKKQEEIIETKKQKDAAKANSVQKSGPQTLIDISLSALIGLLLLIILTLLFRG